MREKLRDMLAVQRNTPSGPNTWGDRKSRHAYQSIALPSSCAPSTVQSRRPLLRHIMHQNLIPPPLIMSWLNIATRWSRRSNFHHLTWTISRSSLSFRMTYQNALKWPRSSELWPITQPPSRLDQVTRMRNPWKKPIWAHSRVSFYHVFRTFLVWFFSFGWHGSWALPERLGVSLLSSLDVAW